MSHTQVVFDPPRSCGDDERIDVKKKKKKRTGGRIAGKWADVTPAEIVTFRQKNKISRAALAGALGVSSTSVQNWEGGQVVAVPKIQAKLRSVIDAGSDAVASQSTHSNSGASIPLAGLGVKTVSDITVAWLNTQGAKTVSDITVAWIHTQGAKPPKPEMVCAAIKQFREALA